jgi:D-alanyl-D-alanine carboxypeptidase
MKKISALLILLRLFSLQSFGQTIPIAIKSEIDTFIKSYKSGMLQQNNVDIPGIIVKVEKVGEWQETFKYGIIDKITNAPLQGNEQFRIGNNSQTFLAAAILKLAQNNALKLSDTISKWLPSAYTNIIPNSNSITIKHLLQHTSGIAGFNEVYFINGDPYAGEITQDWYGSSFKNNYSIDTILFKYYASYPTILLPTKNEYEYSETNYLLVGKIIEMVAGISWQQFVQQNIIAPLGLSKTYCLLDGDTSLPNQFLHGYIDVLDSNNNLLQSIDASVQNNSIYKGSRGMISNIDDLHTFWKSIRNGGIISANSSSKLQTCDAYPLGDTTSFGFGLGCVKINQGYDWIGNEGNIEGYTSAMYYLASVHTYITIVNSLMANSNFPIVAGIENSIVNNPALGLQGSNKSTITIAPNPTTDKISVSTTCFKNNIKMTDVTGRIVLTTKINQSTFQLDISQFKNGIYFLQINKEVIKIIKE